MCVTVLKNIHNLLRTCSKWRRKITTHSMCDVCALSVLIKFSSSVTLNSSVCVQRRSVARYIVPDSLSYTSVMKLPKQISDDLKCSRCEGSLSVSPVMIDKIGTHVCGRCFNLLPEDNRLNFVRELSYEAVASLFRFKCRYSSEGCTFEYPFNRGSEHEKYCSYRYRYFSLKQTNYRLELEKNHAATSFSEERLPLIVVNDNSESSSRSSPLGRTPSYLKQLDKTNSSTDEPQRNCNSGYQSSSNSLETKERTLDTVYSNVSVQSSAEDFYEAIGENHPARISCDHCKNPTENEVFQCLYGHTVCKNCRGRVCAQCDTRISITPYYYCKNMFRGCTIKMKITEITTHEFDCEFGQFPCPLVKCDFTNYLSNLIKHLNENHKDCVFVSDTTKRKGLLKDELWIQIVYNSIFVCKYFWYEEHDEFVAEYVGSQANAKKYKFQVELEGKANNKKIVKKQVCQGWNAKYLDEAIIVTDSELIKINVDVLSFEYTFKILPA